jgi:hypothetical protein
MGFEKAFLFMDKDPDSKSTVQYSSCGIISDQASGLSKKTSFYYLATLQNWIGNATFSKVKSFRENVGQNEIFCIEFFNRNQEKIYALWVRKQNSATDDGTTLSYDFDPGYIPDYAWSVFLKDKNPVGEKTVLSPASKPIRLLLTETPQLLIISEKKATNENLYPENELKIKLNTSVNGVMVFYPKNQNTELHLSVADAAGRKIPVQSFSETSENHKEYRFSNPLKPGIYFFTIHSGRFRKTEKVVIK